jgi:hypothetical protein
MPTCPELGTAQTQLVLAVTFLPEEVIVRFQNVAWGFKLKQNWGSIVKGFFPEKQKVLRINWNGERIDKFFLDMYTFYKKFL